MDISLADILSLLVAAGMASSLYYIFFERHKEDETVKWLEATPSWKDESLANAFSYAKSYQPQPKRSNNCSYCGTRFSDVDNSCKKCGAPID